MVFVYTAMGVLCVEHANVLELCYIELLSGDGSPYSILSGITSSGIALSNKLLFMTVNDEWFIILLGKGNFMLLYQGYIRWKIQILFSFPDRI